MRRSTRWVPLVALVTVLGLAAVPWAREQDRPEYTPADVVVYAATASGAVAAVAAAREGQSVILLEPGQHVGGMVSGGLGATDHGNRKAIGGYAREFFDRVRDYYTKKYGPQSAQVKDCSDGFRFEPHVAELILHEMLKEARGGQRGRVTVLFGQRLKDVSLVGRSIHSISTHKGQAFTARVFIDASYEGDLMAKAGVKYTVGREGSKQYGESIAGVQKYSPAHQWPVKVNGRDAAGKLLPFIQPGGAGEPGAGDKKVQAYNFRLCMTQRPDDLLPWPRPLNYDPQRYELLARYLAKRPDVKVGQLMNPVRMPNGKTDTNNNGPFSTDHIGANWDYPEADYDTRQRIWQVHIDYTQGFLYFLANDPRVPEKLQKEMRSWGLSRGEFKDTDNWPHQLYVREARRMLGQYVMTQADIMDRRYREDSVGLGSYNTDSHHVQRVALADGTVLNEGDFQVRVQPYAISYYSLVPKAAECENLLVPVCLSASHVAYGTIRMEPVYMLLGHACGVAAALAGDGKTTVQAVPLDKLQEKIRSQKAVLSPRGLDRPGGLPQGLDASRLPGIVVDDQDATPTGAWVRSTSIGPFVGHGYLHDNNQDQGKLRVRFTPKLPRAGRYEVRVFYTANANRASNALHVVHGTGDERSVRVNQRLAPKKGEGFSLGVFEFAAGDRGWVEVRNDGADGFVIADAVQFLLQL